MAKNKAAANGEVLITTWVCTVVAFVVIMIRLIGRKFRRQEFVFDDYIAAFSLIILWARVGMIYTVLKYGTNNITSTAGLTEEDIWRHSMGSKLALGTRILYAGFVWCMKYCMIIFYERLTQRQHGYFWATRITKYLLLL